MRLSPIGPGSLIEARTLLASVCAFDEAAIVAEEKLFGDSPDGPATVIGAHDKDGLLGLAVVCRGWLRLLAVETGGHDVGDRLLDEARAVARQSGADRLRAAAQPGNYLTPGIDQRDEATIRFLLRHGYRQVGESENLRVPLADNALVTTERAAAMARAVSGYQLRRAVADDAAGLLPWVERDFGAAWAFETGRALAGGTVHVGLAGDEIVAFAAHDGNNRGLGWFGPAATQEAHRGRGLGAALLLPCLLDVRTAGRTSAVIAWSGPREFYLNAVGATSDRRFVILEEELA